MTITVYHYPNCSTCKKALKWLEAHGVAHERVNIVEAPPTQAVLMRALEVGQLPLRALFNTSGQSYRNGNFKDLLPTLGREAALDALAGDGKLIKRPLVIGPGIALSGFDDATWSRALT